MSNRAVRTISAVLLVSVLLFTVVALAPAAAQTTDPYPGYTLVETISLLSNNSNFATSTTVLAAGVNYKLEASGWVYGEMYVPPAYCFPGYPYPCPGSCDCSSPGPRLIVDAEYADGQDSWMMNPYVSLDVGIWISDPQMYTRQGPHWGPYNGTHIYTIDFTGTGQPIHLVFHGPYVFGPGLTVKIYAPIYQFSGFHAPANEPVNRGKAGRTFPIKWQVADANGNFVNNLALVGPITYTYTGASCPGSSGGTEIPAKASGNSGVRYDTDAQQYVFNWDTPPTPGCYLLSVPVNSAIHEAIFDLR